MTTSTDTAAPGKKTGRFKPRMDAFVSIAAFSIFAILWALFALAVVGNRGSLDATWQWIAQLPLVLQLIVWLLFLPVVAGLWVWQTGWPELVRLIAVAGLGGATLYVFFPRVFLGMRP